MRIRKSQKTDLLMHIIKYDIIWCGYPKYSQNFMEDIITWCSDIVMNNYKDYKNIYFVGFSLGGGQLRYMLHRDFNLFL